MNELNTPSEDESVDLSKQLQELLSLCNKDPEAAWMSAMNNPYTGLMVSQAIFHLESEKLQQKEESADDSSSDLKYTFVTKANKWIQNYWNFGLEALVSENMWGLGIGGLLHIWREIDDNLNTYNSREIQRILAMLEEIKKRYTSPEVEKYVDYNVKQVSEYDSYIQTLVPEKKEELDAFCLQILSSDFFSDCVTEYGWIRTAELWTSILKRHGPQRELFFSYLCHDLAQKIEEIIPRMSKTDKERLILYPSALRINCEHSPEIPKNTLFGAKKKKSGQPARQNSKNWRRRKPSK